MRLDELQEQLGDRINVTWKSYLLRAEPKTGDQEKFVEYTKSWIRPGEMEPKAKFTVWASEESQPNSSIPAQVAFKTVEAIRPDRAKAFHDRLMSAYFTENRNIADSDVLIELAVDVGVDREELVSEGESRRQELTQQVIDEHNNAMSNSVTGIPTVLFENQMPVPGAQPLETYVRLIERIEEHLAST